MLECSPRHNKNRQSIYEKVLGKYLASDFDMSAHATDVRMDLTNPEDTGAYRDAFNIIICAHVLEHIQEYRKALINIRQMLAPEGFAILQVPVLESHYTAVTWDEFHGDNTRVYHRFGFDLLLDLDKVFRNANAVVGSIDFPISSPEINPNKYQFLKANRDRFTILGEKIVDQAGLGIPDLCDAFVVSR